MEPERKMAIVLKLGRILRQDVHEFGPLWVDFGSAEVKRNGKPVFLTNLEFRLLTYLIERAETAVSPGELRRSVLGYESGASTQTVKAHVHMSRLSWKWRKRSSVKIAERTYEKRAQALHC
jgi:DNA-binding response OmpR family regulator